MLFSLTLELTGKRVNGSLNQMDLHEQNMHKLSLYYTLTNYDETYKNVKVVYNKDNITETLGEVLEKQTKLKLELQRLKSILTLLFFSGGREEPFIGESRILKTQK
jgi:2,3-bisphosphoglycerate-independent phosphoglycerate mutase